MVRLLHITFNAAPQRLVLCGRYTLFLDRFMLACELVQVRKRTENKFGRRSYQRTQGNEKSLVFFFLDKLYEGEPVKY